MAVTKKRFGETADGREVFLYTLDNGRRQSVGILTYGATVQSIVTPDKQGVPMDVALGFDSMEGYEAQDTYIGALVGRHANRLKDGRFMLNGREYTLYQNNGRHHMHGGKIGFDRKIWNVEQVGENSVTLSYISPDGEEGYPGELRVKVEYRLSLDGSLSISYEAVSDKDTVVNLTNHSYFNLAGHEHGSILSHRLQLFAERFTKNSAECLPTGEIAEVAGTPLDFRKEKCVGLEIEKECEQLLNCGGYDHNFIVAGEAVEREKETGMAAEAGPLRRAALLREPVSGRCMEVLTTMPGVQLYTGNFLKGDVPGKGGAVYQKRSGLCLETQYYPNAMEQTHFPSPVLRAGEKYAQKTVYRFFTE